MGKKSIIVGIGSVGAGIIESLAKLPMKGRQDDVTYVFIGTEEKEIEQMKKVPAIVHYFFIPTRQLAPGQFADGHKPVDVYREDLQRAILADTLAPLEDLLNDACTLRSGAVLSSSVNIFMIGSLSSAVGGAFTLPIAQYIREHSTKRIIGARLTVSGMFLLPEVLHYLVHGDEEQKMLAKGASMSLQEIKDALEDDEAIFDYCFLLDDQNVNGMVLKDYNEYREYAAACIYSMIMAPDTFCPNDLSVSSVGVVRTKGFSGYGTAIMTYTPERVNEYLASCWAQTLMSDEVFAADLAYKAKRENSLAAGQGTMRESFVSFFADKVDEYGSLEFKIVQQTMKAAPEAEPTEQPVGIEEYYVNALKDFLEQQLDQERDNTLELLITNINNAKAQFNGKKGQTKTTQGNESNDNGNNASGLVYMFDQLYEAEKAYEKYVTVFSKKLSWDLIGILFGYTKSFLNTKQPYRFEYWLQEDNREGSFRHPLAVRLILYRTIRLLKECYAMYDDDCKDANTFISNFDKMQFDDKGTPKVVETKDDYYVKVGFDKTGLAALLSHGDIEDKKKKLLAAYTNLQKQIDAYLYNYVYREVFRKAIDELEKRAECYETFFDTLSRNRKMLLDGLEALGYDSQIIRGRAVVPVCTSNPVMQKLFDTLQDQMTSLTIPGVVYAKLYNEFMKEIAEREEYDGRKEKDAGKRIPTAKRYMMMYQNVLVKELRPWVQSEFGEHYDFDVLSAAELEYRLLDEDAGYRNAEEYTQWMIQTARALATPFVEGTGIKKTAIRHSCTYNAKLESPDLLIPNRQSFVQSNLKAQGGIECPELGTDMILFNQLIPEIDFTGMSWYTVEEE